MGFMFGTDAGRLVVPWPLYILVGLRNQQLVTLAGLSKVL